DHPTARRWLTTALSGSETVGFAWVVLLAFLRVATLRAAFAHPLSVDQATAVSRNWIEAPATVLVSPVPRHLETLAALLAETGSAGNLVTDCHLAALALELGATVVTFDADFGRFRGLHTIRPD
ncbi:MAG: TA system VapC family ribonuclease toxin, partial [Sciscionella sp.]